MNRNTPQSQGVSISRIDEREMEHVNEDPISPSEGYSPTKDGKCETAVNSPADDLKKEFQISTTRMSTDAGSHTFDEQAPSINGGRPWQTTFLRYGPLAGIACMLLAIASIIVSLGILLGSNDQPVSGWGATPSSILAICTAVANQALRFAAFQGFAVAWWFNASRGTTLRQLHLDWRAGTTFLGAFVAGRNMGLIGLACIFSTLVAIDGPLLQKATSVVTAPITNHPVTLNVSMSPEVPHGYSGGWVRTNVTELKFSSMFNNTVPTANGTTPNNIFAYFSTDVHSAVYNKAWFQDETVPGVVSGCDGVCKVTIKAPAFAQTACTTRNIPVDYAAPGSIAGLQSYLIAPPLNQFGYMVTGGLLLGDHERINMITGYSDVVRCAGTFHMDVCTLEPAIGEYDIIVDHGKVIVGEEPPRIVDLVNNTAVIHEWDDFEGYYPSTLAGIASYFFIRSSASVKWFLYEGSVAGMENGNGSPEGYSIPNPRENDPCQSYSNPRPDILQSLNKLVFNVGAVAARQDETYLQSQLDPGLVVNTTTTGYLQGHQNIFRTNLRWFAGAAAVEAICIVLILPTYIGFWRLGRPVSFSPLEVAKAFEAPVFSKFNSNTAGRDIADVSSNVHVQYGAIASPSGQQKLAFGHPSIVRHPAKDSRFEV